MSYGTLGYPFGYVCNVKWQFQGDIPAKVWKSFRTKFAKEHAPGWKIKKRCNIWRDTSQLTVSFQTTNPDTAQGMTNDTWEFLKATIQLLIVQT